VNIRKLEFSAQNDTRRLSYSGCLKRNSRAYGIRRAVQGAIKMLHPLLTAAGRTYVGSRTSRIPYQGIVIAHSNEASGRLKNNRNNELHRPNFLIKVQYCLRGTRRTETIQQLCKTANCKPGWPVTLDNPRALSKLSRLKSHENSNLSSEKAGYDGERLKDTIHARNGPGFATAAGGLSTKRMDGQSRTRFAFRFVEHLQCRHAGSGAGPRYN